MSSWGPVQALRSAPGFDEFFLDVMRYTKVEEKGGSLGLTLSGEYPGERHLGGSDGSRARGWTPLLLAKAMVAFKRGVGGEVRIVAAGPDFVELSQTKCEYGEPRANENSGNLCGVCCSVTASVCRASGIADAARGPAFRCTIAGGARSCDFTVPLSRP